MALGLGEEEEIEWRRWTEKTKAWEKKDDGHVDCAGDGGGMAGVGDPLIPFTWQDI